MTPFHRGTTVVCRLQSHLQTLQVDIGVAVRRWVTWHGLALNVTTDLEAFQSFSPCGLSPEVMTNLGEALGGGAPPADLMERAKAALVGSLGARFPAPAPR